MSVLFWISCAAMLIAAIGFIVVPLKTGKSLFATPTAVIALVLPLAGVGLYALLGSPETISTESASNKHVPVSATNGDSTKSLDSVGGLIGGLRARLENEPDDAGGWMLLARSYQHLGQPTEAMDAYRRAKSLGESDLEFEASLLGPGLATQLTAADSAPTLRGRVSLSPEAAAQVQASDTVFIFAKESREHRMPVVALRKPASDLPIDFVMTEKEMMVPDTHLTDFENLVVTAKISRSGSANDNSPGLEAWSEPVSPLGSDRIDLLIAPAPNTGNTGDE